MAVTMSRWSWGAVFDERHRARLAACADLLHDGRPLRSAADAAVVLPSADVVVTGWGAVPLDDELLAVAPDVQLVAHAAGSVKGLVGPAGWDRGITVTSAADENARPVAEYTLAAVLLAGKRAFTARDAYRASGKWPSVAEGLPVPGNRGKVLGVIGASRVGRAVLELVRRGGFELEAWVADPYLDEAGAAELGARLVDLDELVAGADVVSLHAPLLPETTGLIDARRLALLKDGAVFVNTARGAIVDGDALVAELATGRISAVIDTTDPEPLPAGHPLLGLDHAFVTPHLAGSTGTELGRLADAAIGEVERFAAGLPPRSPVTATDLPRIA